MSSADSSGCAARASGQAKQVSDSVLQGKPRQGVVTGHCWRVGPGIAGSAGHCVASRQLFPCPDVKRREGRVRQPWCCFFPRGGGAEEEDEPDRPAGKVEASMGEPRAQLCVEISLRASVNEGLGVEVGVREEDCPGCKRQFGLVRRLLTLCSQGGAPSLWAGASATERAMPARKPRQGVRGGLSRTSLSGNMVVYSGKLVVYSAKIVVYCGGL